MTTPQLSEQQLSEQQRSESTDTAVQILGCGEVETLCQDDPSIRVLDVRTGGEYETVHIPDSINIPLDQLGEHAAQVAGIDRPIVLVCQSGVRAEQAHARLSQAGKGRLFVLDGGLNAWETAGNQVNRGQSNRWAMDRQVRFVAGLMIITAVVVSTIVPPVKWVAAAVAGGLVYSAASNTCAMASILGRLPYNRSTVDVDTALEKLA